MLEAFSESVHQGSYTQVGDTSNPLLGTSTKEDDKQVAAAFMLARGDRPLTQPIWKPFITSTKEYKGYVQHATLQ
jgi:hypothetical protein